METTAGVTCSAMDVNARLRSVIAGGGTIGATDDTGRVDDCAYPNLVRSSPEANTRPPRKAAASAPPSVIREMGDFMADPVQKVQVVPCI